jgi:hypothetical protein
MLQEILRTDAFADIAKGRDQKIGSPAVATGGVRSIAIRKVPFGFPLLREIAILSMSRGVPLS